MSIPLVVNGVTYDYPEVDDVDWGAEATDWAAAVTSGMLQKAGGLFQILAEVDFGTSFGLKSLYYKSRTANPADAGQFRLARADVINWRNNANSANLSLGVSASDVLQFNGSDIQGSISVADTSTIDLTFSSNTLSADIIAGSITNSMINAAAAIAFSKLEALASGNILVGSAGNVATSLAMTGDITITNAGVTAIGTNKVTNAMLAQVSTATFKGRTTAGTGNVEDLTATQATALLNVMVGDSGAGGTKGLVPAPITGDATKFLNGAGAWSSPAGAGDVVGPASATDNGFVRFDGTTGKLIKNSAATITNADVVAAAGIALNKLAATTVSRALVSDGSGFVSAATTTATEIGYVNGVTSAIQTSLDAKQVRSTLTAKGDLYVATASNTVTRQGVGADGTYIIADSSQTNGIKYVYGTVQSKNSAYTILVTDDLIYVDTTGGSVIVTFPSFAANSGKTWTVKKADSTFNTVTLACNGSENLRDIGTTATTTLNTQGESATVESDGTVGQIIDRRIPSVWTAFTSTMGLTGGTTTAPGFWKRDGDSAIFQISATFASVFTAGSATFSIPFTIDTAKFGATPTSNSDILGTARVVDVSVTGYIGVVLYSSTTALSVRYMVDDTGPGSDAIGAGSITTTTPFTWANGDQILLSTQPLPISGWKG